jgi:hypothetical protein
MTNNFEYLSNGEYPFRYLANSTSQKIFKFNFQSRRGTPQSDWFSGNSWGNPIVSIAPPKESGVICH